MIKIEVITRKDYTPTMSVKGCEDFIRNGGYWYYTTFIQAGVNLIVRNWDGFLINNDFEDIELGMNIGVEAVKEAKNKRFNRSIFLKNLLGKKT